MSANARKSLATAAAIAAVMALAAPASAQVVAPVDVKARAPTQVVITLAGKSGDQVRVEVKGAARTVCRNAVNNHDLAFYDLTWCRQKTEVRAMRDYASIAARYSRQAAAPATIVISMR